MRCGHEVDVSDFTEATKQLWPLTLESTNILANYEPGMRLNRFGEAAQHRNYR